MTGQIAAPGKGGARSTERVGKSKTRSEVLILSQSDCGRTTSITLPRMTPRHGSGRDGRTLRRPARSGVPREALNSFTPPQRPLMEKAAADLKKGPRGSRARHFAKLAALFGTAGWAPRRVEGDAEVGEETDRDTQKGRPKRARRRPRQSPTTTTPHSTPMHFTARRRRPSVGARAGTHLRGVKACIATRTGLRRVTLHRCSLSVVSGAEAERPPL